MSEAALVLDLVSRDQNFYLSTEALVRVREDEKEDYEEPSTNFKAQRNSVALCGTACKFSGDGIAEHPMMDYNITTNAC